MTTSTWIILSTDKGPALVMLDKIVAVIPLSTVDQFAGGFQEGCLIEVGHGWKLPVQESFAEVERKMREASMPCVASLFHSKDKK